MSFELPKLPYSYDALEPVIDAKTMEIHHTKHHAAYTSNLNTALETHVEYETMKVEDVLKNIDDVPEEIRTAVINNGGGFYNHSLFWEVMTPGGASEPTGDLATMMDSTYESLDEFKSIFSKTAMTRFGSGWAWLAVNGNNDVEILSTANQNSPLMTGLTPILGIDVWEHAYYLNYQNRRAEYVEKWLEIVNWDIVSEKYSSL